MTAAWLVAFAAVAVTGRSATADPATPIVRIGGTLGFQQSDRSAWVFGPALEVAIYRELSLHGDAQLELGDFGDPFGPSNIRGGSGPHVNHVMFGPVWRPPRYEKYQLATGVEFGVLVMHSTFAADHFTKRPAAGLFVQAGRALGPLAVALQLRLDLSTTVSMGGPDGKDVPTTTGRLNLLLELPIRIH